jgi:hypothetical protein
VRPRITRRCGRAAPARRARTWPASSRPPTLLACAARHDGCSRR